MALNDQEIAEEFGPVWADEIAHMDIGYSFSMRRKVSDLVNDIVIVRV